MGTEIERKFLVEDSSILITAEHNCFSIRQYYINENTRIRHVGHSDGSHKTCMTIKHKKEEISRYEWEFEIDFFEALDYCEYLKNKNIGLGMVVKTRHVIRDCNGLDWYVDVFHDENEGLILAEIEIPRKDFPFDKLGGIGEEVTNDERYYNSYLAKNPYKNWSK